MTSLAFWSAVNIVERIVALLILVYVARIQLKTFEHKSSLQPLKRILFYIPIAVGVTNIPQLFLSWGRMHGNLGSKGLTALATVSNGTGVFLIAVLLFLVYTYKGQDADE